MKGRKNSETTRPSRRHFLKFAGFSIAASGIARNQAMLSVPHLADQSDAELDAEITLAAAGLPIKLTGSEIGELRKNIQENRKNLDQIRRFRVQARAGPAFVFHAA
jgi:hypothetical protein